MTYDELLENARKYLGPHCKGCAVCNGAACRNTMPGPGAKGTGDKKTYERRKVVTGLSDGINIEIKSGVSAKDRVRGPKKISTDEPK